METGISGSVRRSATAAASTSAIAAAPLIRATAGASSECAVMPGYSVAGVAKTTSDSPSEGSTRPMCCRKDVFGPTTSTPCRSNRARCVYSR